MVIIKQDHSYISYKTQEFLVFSLVLLNKNDRQTDTNVCAAILITTEKSRVT
jgi:hypothetical protein